MAMCGHQNATNLNLDLDSNFSTFYNPTGSCYNMLIYANKDFCLTMNDPQINRKSPKKVSKSSKF